MSIKPVDMQVLLPRSQEIQRGEALKDQRAGANSQFVLVDNEKETEKNIKQVKETTKGEEGKINEERSKQKNFDSRKFSSHQKKQNIDKKEKEDDFTPETLGKNIDIMI
ncbi:MAG TPA: hypothetical protein GX522_05200 [Firmicutes bacterium]|jgi:hypothetical protein|nr:hypothetical protein [Bacillota bacterium]